MSLAYKEYLADVQERMAAAARAGEEFEETVMSARDFCRRRPAGKGKTQQKFAKDCDVNAIVKKFQKTGAMDHVSHFQPQYGDFTGPDFHAAMTIVAGAQQMFESLPSSLRKKFENDPAKFLDFVQDEKNAKEAEELGLVTVSAADSADAVASAVASAKADAGAADEGGVADGSPPSGGEAT